MKLQITKSKIQELFDYKDGFLFKKNDKKVASLDVHGYVKIMVDKKYYRSHQLIFMLHHGFIPKEIDHIDGNRSNNLIENLRETNKAQNQWNRGLQKNNTSGYKNVNWNKFANKWQVQLRVNRRQKSFGLYDNLELADLVAQEARSKYHGNFAKHS